MTDLVLLKLADDEWMPVPAELLSENSPVFQRLLNELHQTEIDMDDFHTDVVTL